MCCGPSLTQRIAKSQNARARDEALLEAVRRDAANNDLSSLLLPIGYSSNLAGFAQSNGQPDAQAYINTSTSSPSKKFTASNYELKHNDDEEEDTAHLEDGQSRRVSVISDDDHSAGALASSSSVTIANLSEARKKKRKRRRKKLEPGLTAKGDERQFVKHNYHDHANDSEEEYRQSADKSHSNTGGVSVPFPFKLHEMLDAIEEDGYASIVSWQPHGRCFKIHKKAEFVEQIMPRYFQQTKLTSFQRQLNLYGFIRLSRGRDEGAYYHERFLRGRQFLSHSIVRCKCKGTRFKAASDPEAEPDFSCMPAVTAWAPAHKDEKNNKQLASIVSEESMHHGSHSPEENQTMMLQQPAAAPSALEQLFSAVAAVAPPAREEPSFDEYVVPMVIDCCLSDDPAADVPKIQPNVMIARPTVVAYPPPTCLTARLYGFDVPVDRPPAYEFAAAVDPYPLSIFDWGVAPEVDDQAWLSVLSSLNDGSAEESAVASSFAPSAATVDQEMQDDTMFGDIVATLLSEGIGEGDFRDDAEFGRYLEKLIE